MRLVPTHPERKRKKFEVGDQESGGHYGFGLSWKKQWNAKSFTNIQAGHSGYCNDYSNNIVLSGDTARIIRPNQTITVNYLTNETNDLTDYFISFQNKYILNRTHQLELGAALKYNEFKFYKDASTDFVYNNLENYSLLYSVYFQDRLTIDKWAMKPGFRVNYYDKTNKIYFEPHFAASYRTNNGIIYKIAVSLLNVLNTANYLDIYIRDFDFGNNEFTETTLVKAQELTFNFFVNFRF